MTPLRIVELEVGRGLAHRVTIENLPGFHRAKVRRLSDEKLVASCGHLHRTSATAIKCAGQLLARQERPIRYHENRGRP